MSSVATVSDARVVFVTAPSEAVAEQLVRAVVSERLAACGTLFPGVRSLYRWKGELCEDTEVQILLKTCAGAVDALTARLVEIHPYEVPEVLAVSVAAGLPAYLSWVGAQVVATPGD